MSVFDNVYFISLQPEFNPKSFNCSYYLTKRPASQWVEIDLERKRNLLGGKKAMFCGVNFFFNQEDGRIDNEALNINEVKTNKKIAEEILHKFLMKITSYSAVYIKAHGNKDENCFGQEIKYYDALHQIQEVAVDLDANYIATLFFKYIPRYAQNNLKIHVLSCYGENIANTLMHAFHKFGFKKTSVTGYCNKTYINANDEAILDFCSFTHGYCDHNGAMRHLGQEESKLDDKATSHNYNGYVEKESYESFKKYYLKPSLENKQRGVKCKANLYLSDIKYRREYQLTVFIDILNRAVQKYIHVTQQSQKIKNNNLIIEIFRQFPRHSDDGLARAFHFLDRILSYVSELFSPKNMATLSAEVCNDSDNLFIDKIETNIRREIFAFVKKTGKYETIPGAINVKENSCLTYILRALNKFFLKFPYETLCSEAFQEFIMFITNGSPNALKNKGSPWGDRVLFLWDDTEATRLHIKMKIEKSNAFSVDE